MTATTAQLLTVTNLEVVYGRTVRAVQGVSFAVPEGAITAIVGANGAGKSTTLAAIAGHLSTDDVDITEGDIVVDGRSCRDLPPHVISRAGVALVPERGKIFGRLTVQENLRAARTRRRGGTAVTDADVLDLFPRLAGVGGRVAGYLSGGERQMLAIAMGLLNNPRILLIDEFSLGLAPTAVDELVAALRRIRVELDLALLVVEQSAGVAVRLADYVYVMEGGRMVFEGASEKVVENEDFREFYLGLAVGDRERSYRDVKQYEKKKRWFG